MGGGGYSSYARRLRAEEEGYYTKSREQIFSQREVHEGMNPKGVKIRESRDSEEHPQSLAIILALDENGSMGHMPHNLIKDGLPTIMETIMAKGVHHPQVMFCGIGDAHNDEQGPLQISQFESSDLLLDNWLTKIFLEQNGGGNGGRRTCNQL